MFSSRGYSDSLFLFNLSVSLSLSLSFLFCPSLAILFAYAAGEVNSGRVCLHFHCLVSVCGLPVFVLVAAAVVVVVGHHRRS